MTEIEIEHKTAVDLTGTPHYGSSFGTDEAGRKWINDPDAGWYKRWQFWASTVAVPATVTATAGVAEWMYDDTYVAAVEAAVALSAGALAKKSLTARWPLHLSWGAVALSAAGVQAFATTVAPLFATPVAFLAASGGAVAARLVYRHNTRNDRFQQMERNAKFATSRIKQELDQAKKELEQAKLSAAHPAPGEHAPVFPGPAPEAVALQRAFWDVYKLELHSFPVEETGTGWVARVSLPVLPSGLSRDTIRGQWDKISTHMGLNGKFKVLPGTLTNQLDVRFVDNNKASDVPMTGWHPGAPWAIVADTGDVVPVPLGRRILFAGTSGSGKSWSARPLMAEASEYADHRLVLFDMKHTEARNWQHRARIATELDQIDLVTSELIEEGERRLKLIPRGRDVVEISEDTPRITVFVDEGGELLSALGEEIVERFRTIARKYRAAEIILVWCTQKPALSGNGHGIDSQISGQMVNRLSLSVATPTESRVVFGEDAGDKGWDAHELPMPGWALLRDIENQSAPERLRMRAMSPADVIALPDRPVWFLDGDRSYSGDEQYRELADQASATPEDPKDAACRMRSEGMTVPRIAEVSGVSESTVKRWLKDC